MNDEELARIREAGKKFADDLSKTASLVTESFREKSALTGIWWEALEEIDSAREKHGDQYATPHGPVGRDSLLLHLAVLLDFDEELEDLTNSDLEKVAKTLCQERHASGKGRWDYVFFEEVAEALGATTVEELRGELLQVMAMAAVWIRFLDRDAEAAAQNA